MIYANPAAIFSGIGENYGRYRVPHPDLFLDLIAQTAPSGAILDLGCGAGIMTSALAGRGRDVIGLDVNEDLIADARSTAARSSVGHRVRWQLGDVHGLSSGSPVAAVTIADAFHWFDRAELLRSLDDLVLPGGLVAVVMSYSAGTPKPWWHPLVERVIDRHLGTDRYAGAGTLYRPSAAGDHETVLRDSAFNSVSVLRTDRRIRMTLEDVMGNVYTQAYASPPVLGEKRADFDRDLRALLMTAEPTGIFTAITRPGLIIARREAS
jgi:trans-aconitate methyltransferase